MEIVIKSRRMSLKESVARTKEVRNVYIAL